MLSYFTKVNPLLDRSQIKNGLCTVFMLWVSITAFSQATVSITASEPNASEAGPTSGEFTISVSDGPDLLGGTIEVFINIDIGAANSATPGVDYTALQSSYIVTYFAITGNGSRTINVNPMIDGFAEGAEIVKVDLVLDAAYTFSPPNDSAIVTIDDSVLVEFFQPTGSANEDVGNDLPRLLVNGYLEDPTTIVVRDLATGTADVSDYVFDTADGVENGRVTINLSGTYNNTIIPVPTLSITDDNIVEPDETIRFRLVTPGAGVNIEDQNETTYTIVNDDSATLTIADAPNVEEGSGNLVYTVTLNNAVQGGTTVGYTVTGGTATNVSDYSLVGSSLSFTGAAGQQRNITVNVNDDSVVEADETVEISLGTPSAAGVSVVGNPAIGTILNDDSATVTIANDTDGEENSGGTPTNGIVVVSMDSPSSTDTDITYTAGGSADPGDDYVALSGTVTIPAGDTEAEIEIDVTEDGLVEGDETVIITLTGTSNTDITLGTPASATNTIADDDVATLTIENVTRAENVTGGNMVFTVTLDNPVSGGVEVDYSFTDGTATGGGVDYTATAGTLEFDGTLGEQETITVSLVNDGIVEGNETFTVLLANATNGVNITGSPATGTITNDDFHSISIGDVSRTEGNSGTTAYQFVVRVDGGGNALYNIGFDFATANGTATVADSDYMTNSGTRQITAGNPSTTIIILVNGDTKVESDETFRVLLSNISVGTISDNEGVGTITNDDTAMVTIGNASGNEDDGPIGLTATLNNGVVGGFSVQVSTTDGTATLADNDYTALGGLTLTFSGTAGETETFEVAPVADAIIEDNENLVVSMGNLSGTTFSIDISDTATVTILNDDSCAAGSSAPTSGPVNDTFCDEVSQDLDVYATLSPPQGSDLVWSSNPNTDVTDDFLPSSIVTAPGTYYGFFYDALNDCASPTFEVQILLNETPNPGTTTNVSTCSDSGLGNSIVDLDDQLTGADAGTWSLTSGPIGHTAIIGTGNVVDFDGQPEGEFIFTYTTDADAPCVDQTVNLGIMVEDCTNPCNAGNSAPILDPSEPTIFCGSINADLNDYVTSTTAPAGSVLTWSYDEDPWETNAHLVSSVVTSSGSYYGFFYDEVNNCSSPVVEIFLDDYPIPIIESTTGASRCDEGTLTLSATATVEDGNPITLNWYDAPSGGVLMGIGSTFETTVTETTSYYVSATANGCTSERVEVVATINDTPLPGVPIEGVTACNVSSDEGPNILDLDETLMGQDPGTWAIITDPSNGSLTIGTGNSVDFTGLTSGTYVFEYTTNGAEESCENASVQVSITVEDCISNAAIDLALTKSVDNDTPLLNAEVTFTITLENTTMDRATGIVVNDVLANGFDYVSHSASIGLYDPTTGEWTIDELGAEEMATLDITVAVTILGQLENTAIISTSFPVDGDVSNNSDTVSIQVNESACKDPGTICNIFSPNGDGKNDRLKLVGHEQFPGNRLEIFDRYGNSVFQMNGYDSTWEGSGKNGDLPRGTYFYILDLGDGSDVAKGWIQIIR